MIIKKCYSIIVLLFESFKISLTNYKKNNIYKCVCDCDLKDLFIKSINLLFKNIVCLYCI